jgi:phthalate 4,5-dioxygenase oxygenase subunit
MLTREENELLVRTGPGTPMGKLIRRYWVPALFSEKLPKPDCPPVRVKLLSENLVAFRDSQGRVGLVDERCPHRGASLFFGRNEEAGLRCVYHGWKFDVDGKCVDMPSEPAESNFKNKVQINAYPCLERGGVIWTYMGPADKEPAFPDIEWTNVPESHRFATRHIQECNWFQALEGGFDTSHLTFLHRGDTPDGATRPVPQYYHTLRTDFGYVSGSGRDTPDGGRNYTVNAMLMPFHKVISRGGDGTYPTGAHMWVPIDDENCMIYSIEYRPERPLNDKEMERSHKWLYIHAETLPGSDRCVANLDNDFLIDRELQASGKSYTGFKGFGIQDCGIQESIGPISDRTLEHLGVSDAHIIQLRKMMLKFVKELQEGIEPPGFDPKSYRVRSGGFTVPKGRKFEDLVMDYVKIDKRAEAAVTAK